MTTNIPTWLPTLETWEQLKYDGIMGFPPKWVPKPNKDKFNMARFLIFSGVEKGKYHYNEIKQRFDKLVSDKNYRLVLALMKDRKPYDENLFYLVELYDATLLGEIEGLRVLGGDIAVMGKRKSISTSKNASKPRPKKNYENETLDAVIAGLKRNYPNEKPSEIWVHFKTAIEDWSECEDCSLYGEKDSQSYHYEMGDKRGSITYGTFRKKLKK